MAEPTQAEWDAAANLLDQIWDMSLAAGAHPIVAQALADQRAKYEAVADELDGWRDNAERYAVGAGLDERMKARAREAAYQRASEAIRKVSAS